MKYITDKFGQPVNPFDYNYVASKRSRELEEKKKAEKLIGDNVMASQMIQDPDINIIAKFLGVGDKVNFAEYYDKLKDVINWAIEKTDSTDLDKITQALKDKINTSPHMNDKPFLDLWCAVKINLQDEPEKDHNGNKIKEDKKEEVLEV